MYLYLHGFASTGNATKAGILRKFMEGRDEVLSPDLPVEPTEALKLAEKIVKENPDIRVFGSSLGGFYALYLTSHYGCKVYLINPAIMPQRDLAGLVGINKNFSTNEEFEFRQEYIQQLEDIYYKIEPSKIKAENITLLLSEDDIYLDYRETLAYLVNGFKKLILKKDAKHEFLCFEEVLKELFP